VPARLSAQHSMAVLPFVEGTAGQWGDQPPAWRSGTGEPHPGTLIMTKGHRLIDWGAAALAFAERDLWMLDDGSADGFAALAASTDTVARPEVEWLRAPSRRRPVDSLRLGSRGGGGIRACAAQWLSV
jgi:hypothetical protein